MNAGKTAVFWIANGFDPEDPHQVDTYSLTALEAAVKRYWVLKEQGREVVFPIIKSIVRDRSSRIILHETLFTSALQAGVGIADLVVLPTETTGSPTDGLSIAIFRSKHPDTIIEIFVTTLAVARYFTVMYSAVAKYCLKCDLSGVIISTIESVSWKSKMMYKAFRFATIVTAKTRWTFLLWYKLLNFAYSRRLKGFGRTVN